jgi:hypothetical protein
MLPRLLRRLHDALGLRSGLAAEMILTVGYPLTQRFLNGREVKEAANDCSAGIRFKKPFLTFP